MSRYVYGLDPASKMDYFGLVVHEILDKGEGEKNMPRLVTLRMYKNLGYDTMLDILQKGLFRKFPPFLIVIDYSNERTFSDILERYYKKKVVKISFTNTSKLMLKEDGHSILKEGYEFPNPITVKDIKQKRWLEILIKQLKKEQRQTTRSGKTTFDHPQGEHNDLAIAWELSIHGCLKLMRTVPTRHLVASKKFNPYDPFDDFGSGTRSGLQSLGRTVYYPHNKRFYEL